MNDLNTQKPTKKRFTFLINSQLLSKIKLISYFTNQKLNETINNSLKDYILKFETQSNTKIDSLINLSSNFQTLSNNTSSPIIKDKNK